MGGEGKNLPWNHFRNKNLHVLRRDLEKFKKKVIVRHWEESRILMKDEDPYLLLSCMGEQF